MEEQIDKIELVYLKKEDHQDIVKLMEDEYRYLDDSVWTQEEFYSLIEKFPEGQVAIKINDNLAGFALSIIVDYNKFDDTHSYKEITGNYTFSTHDNNGNMLYGVDVFINKKFRGLRLGRRLYEFRKELCEEKNLKGIIFGGRIPNYSKYANEITPKEYIQKVKSREIYDPVLNFQLSNDFYVKRVIKNYLEGDIHSKDYACLLKWDNIYYSKPTKEPMSEKTVIRLGLIQWQVRPYKNIEEVLEQAEYFVNSVSSYRSDS